MAFDNPHWHELDGAEALVSFRGPNAYVSPQWYESGTNAPTWNYTAVHVYGTIKLIRERDSLLELMEKMVWEFEKRFATQRGIVLQPERLERLLTRIVGFELPIDRFEGKAQLNQNRSLMDQTLVARALKKRPDKYCRDIAKLMFENIHKREER